MVQHFYLGTQLLGGVKDATSVIIPHEQTQSNRICCFQNLDAVFPKDLFPDVLEMTTAVVVPCGGPKTSPRTSIYNVVIFTFSGPLGL